VWINLGVSYNWNPSTWTYPVPAEVSALIYESERTCNDMLAAYDSQMGDYGLDFYHSGSQALHRIQKLNKALVVLRNSAGTVSDDVLKGLVENVMTAADKVDDSFTRHPYLEQLVPDYWSDLSQSIQGLGSYYGLN